MPTTPEPQPCPLCDAPVPAVQLRELKSQRFECKDCKTYVISDDATQHLNKSEEANRLRLLATTVSRREAAEGRELVISGWKHFVEIAADEQGRQSGGDIPPK